MNEPELLSLLDPKIISNDLENYLPGQKVAKIHMNSTENTILSLEGSSNLLIKINLEDGQTWFMRIRKRSAGRPYPDEVLRMNLESEVATCQALFDGGVAVPQTFIRPRDSKRELTPYFTHSN
uniref:Aminoglycoside phosphotransferase domain-containing protein n=1 Tax=Kwoniella bestiolae CBS 10118 TaxID=1296100 RepID=A0A1B9GDH3_9TREE|nr:hypothetical protein I302_00570 [Kwoniella bestiolae CBS 10118]OCF29079.1 hypothetical protein I302_00570 [Kwoniella bestiolae CBS 10118]